MINNLFAKQDSLGKSLATMVAKGLVTLRQLDEPSDGWKEIERSRIAAQSPLDPHNPTQKVPWYNRDHQAYETFPLPTQKVPATRPAYRNLAREWIAANKKEWVQLLETHGKKIQALEEQHPPGEELDGVTVFTNDHPIPPELPF